MTTITAEAFASNKIEQDYPDDVRVFKIDDGERHWYVAKNQLEALREHYGIMEPDDQDEIRIVPVASDQTIDLRIDDPDDEKAFGPEWFRVEREGHLPLIRGYAGMWAARYADKAAAQICSSVL